jgi:hypothetical protein
MPRPAAFPRPASAATEKETADRILEQADAPAAHSDAPPPAPSSTSIDLSVDQARPPMLGTQGIPPEARAQSTHRPPPPPPEAPKRSSSRHRPPPQLPQHTRPPLPQLRDAGPAPPLLEQPRPPTTPPDRQRPPNMHRTRLRLSQSPPAEATTMLPTADNGGSEKSHPTAPPAAPQPYKTRAPPVLERSPQYKRTSTRLRLDEVTKEALQAPMAPQHDERQPSSASLSPQAVLASTSMVGLSMGTSQMPPDQNGRASTPLSLHTDELAPQ